MPLEPIRLERKEARDSYAAMFSSAVAAAGTGDPLADRGPQGQRRRQALQRLSQQRDGKPDRGARGHLSRGAAHHGRRVLSGRWRAFTFGRRRRVRRCCSNMAETFRPSSRATNMRRTCLGLPMWRASSAPGSTPITRRTPSRCRRPRWPSFRPSVSTISSSRRIRPTRIVRSRFAAVTIFAANRSRDPFEKINAGQPEDALITRPGFRGGRAASAAPVGPSFYPR